MVACIIGTILSIENRSMVIEDRLTKQQYNCEPEGNEFLDLKIGQNGIFVGQYLEPIFKVKRINIRKFLDPLYEVDLYDASGKFNLIPVLDDPFIEAYLTYMKKQEELDSLKELESEVENGEFTNSETGMP